MAKTYASCASTFLCLLKLNSPGEKIPLVVAGMGSNPIAVIFFSLLETDFVYDGMASIFECRELLK